MSGSVAGYAKYHYYLGTPQERADKEMDGVYGKGRKKWVKTIRPRKKKYPMILRDAK